MLAIATNEPGAKVPEPPPDLPPLDPDLPQEEPEPDEEPGTRPAAGTGARAGVAPTRPDSATASAQAPAADVRILNRWGPESPSPSAGRARPAPPSTIVFPSKASRRRSARSETSSRELVEGFVDA
jgi:hypothetical protein